MSGRACSGGRLALLATLLLAACGSEPLKGDAVEEGERPVASAPIVDQGSGNAQAPAEAAQSNLVTPPVPPIAPAPPSVRPSMPPYRAIGTEPFWAVTVKGSSAVLERPDKPPRSFAVSRNDDGRALRYLGEGFSMTVTQGPCSDGMSDAIWSDQVSVAFGEGTLKGCGGDRQDPEGGPL